MRQVICSFLGFIHNLNTFYKRSKFSVVITAITRDILGRGGERRGSVHVEAQIRFQTQ